MDLVPGGTAQPPGVNNHAEVASRTVLSLSGATGDAHRGKIKVLKLAIVELCVHAYYRRDDSDAPFAPSRAVACREKILNEGGDLLFNVLPDGRSR